MIYFHEGWDASIEEILVDINKDLMNKEVNAIASIKEGSIHIQLWGWEIVLLPDSTYYFNDTSGG